MEPGRPNIANLENGTVVVPTLPSGGSVNFGVIDNVTAIGGTVTNTFSAATPSGVTDPNLANNSQADTDNVEPPVDIGVVVTASTVYYAPNHPLTYTITVKNYGPTTLTSIQLVPQIPSQLAGATFTYTPSTSSYDPVTHTWSGLNFATGDAITMTATVTVPADATGTITYGVQVSPNDAVDTNLSNNQSSTNDDPESTAVEMTLFKAQWQNSNGVVLSWTTVQETHIVGFNIYRRANPQSAWQLVNASLIASKVPGSLSGADYTFTDLTTDSKVWYEYRIDCINTASAVSSSLSTTVFTDPYQMFLPQIMH